MFLFINTIFLLLLLYSYSNTAHCVLEQLLGKYYDLCYDADELHCSPGLSRNHSFFFLILWFLSLFLHHCELVTRIGAFTFLLWAIPERRLSPAHPPWTSPSHISPKLVLSTSLIRRCSSAVSPASLPHQAASVSTAASFLPGPSHLLSHPPLSVVQR